MRFVIGIKVSLHKPAAGSGHFIYIFNWATALLQYPPIKLPPYWQ